MTVTPLNLLIAIKNRSLKELGIPRTQNREDEINNTKPNKSQ